MSRKFKTAVTIIVVVALWVFLAPLLADFLIVEKPLEKADAIWILGGSGTYRERTQFAAELYKKNAAEKIFLVNDGEYGGWNRVEKRNLPYYEISQRELISQGFRGGNRNIVGQRDRYKLRSQLIYPNGKSKTSEFDFARYFRLPHPPDFMDFSASGRKE